MHVPQLQQREDNQTKHQNPCLPSPELVVAAERKQEQLNSALREQEAHAGEDA